MRPVLIGWEVFIRGFSIAVVITAHHVLRCAVHRSKQPLMGELQGWQRNEQMIRLLTV